MKYLITICFLFIAHLSEASSQTGTVTRISARADGLHYFELIGSRGEKPSCSANHTYWMIKDENSAPGKSQFSMLLSAYISNKIITIQGEGECTRWGDGEDIRTVILGG